MKTTKKYKLSSFVTFIFLGTISLSVFGTSTLTPFALTSPGACLKALSSSTTHLNNHQTGQNKNRLSKALQGQVADPTHQWNIRRPGQRKKESLPADTLIQMRDVVFQNELIRAKEAVGTIKEQWLQITKTRITEIINAEKAKNPQIGLLGRPFGVDDWPMLGLMEKHSGVVQRALRLFVEKQKNSHQQNTMGLPDLVNQTLQLVAKDMETQANLTIKNHIDNYKERKEAIWLLESHQPDFDLQPMVNLVEKAIADFHQSLLNVYSITPSNALNEISPELLTALTKASNRNASGNRNNDGEQDRKTRQENSLLKVTLDLLKSWNVEASAEDLEDPLRKRELKKRLSPQQAQWFQSLESTAKLWNFIKQQRDLNAFIESDYSRTIYEMQPRPWIPHLENGKFISHFPNIKVSVSYEPNLATNILYPSGPIVGKPQFPILVNVHGAGTNQSTGQSFKHLLSLLNTANFNPVAFDSAYSGVGPHLPSVDLKTYTDYMNLVGTYFQEEARIAGAASSPITYGGRSSGSLLGLFHAILYDHSDNPYTNYSLISLAHPFYANLQIDNVREGHRLGHYPSIDERVLEHFLQLSEEAIKFLNDNKETLKKAADHVTAEQGDWDEDGIVDENTSALDALRTLSKEYLPRMHVYPLYNPLKEHPLIKAAFAKGILKNPADFEASHFLLSPRANMTADQWEKMMTGIVEEWRSRFPNEPIPENPTVDPIDYPALGDQFIEIMASRWANYDYLIESNSQEPGMIRAREKLAPYRESVLQNSSEKTFFRWYVASIMKKYKFTEQDWETAAPGNRGLLPRLKKAEAFWKAEQVRIAELIANETVGP